MQYNTTAVTRKGPKVEQLIQVCYDMSSEKTRKRELDALVEAAEELNYDNLIIITNSQEEKNRVEGLYNIIKICNPILIKNGRYFIW